METAALSAAIVELAIAIDLGNRFLTRMSMSKLMGVATVALVTGKRLLACMRQMMATETAALTAAVVALVSG